MESIKGKHDVLNAKKTDAAILAFAAASFIMLIPIYLFPILFQLDEFVAKFNHVFGMGISQKYEGGIMTWVIMGGTLPELCPFVKKEYQLVKRLYKEGMAKSCLYGFFSCICVFLCMYISFLYISKDIECSYGTYDTQLGRENRDLDSRINMEKSRMIQKAVDDYNRGR